MLGDFILLRICEVCGIYAEVFAEAYDVDALTVLRHTEVHCIDNLRWHDIIADFIQCVEYGL